MFNWLKSWFRPKPIKFTHTIGDWLDDWIVVGIYNVRGQEVLELYNHDIKKVLTVDADIALTVIRL